MPQLRLHDRGVYIAQLDPTVGGEIRKTRPVVIVSNDAINTHSRVVVIGSRAAWRRKPLPGRQDAGATREPWELSR